MGVIGHVGHRRTREQNDALVLGLLNAADRPVSAYEISDMARASGTSLVPNQVYRTMARMLEQRRVRRIETLNAWLPWLSAADLCLVCTQCHAVALIRSPSLGQALEEVVAGAGFHPSVTIVEMLGRCHGCLKDPSVR